ASNSPADVDDHEDSFDEAMTLGQSDHEQPCSESEE
ncbi:TIGR03761 family integrating conjugative element protein, partial [Pseudomonas amygdali pv. lachrymans]